jgi:futalosine hydrolase
VKAITVNTVHGKDESIQRVIKKFHPDIESMEGAAFFYVCMMEKIPCIQLRSISNRIERRNRADWDILLSLSNLNEVLSQFFNTLKEQKPSVSI